MSNWKLVHNSTEYDFLTDFGFTVTAAQGVGMPPIANVTRPYALTDGSAYQRSLARERVITLIGIFSGTSMTTLYSKRKSLVDVLEKSLTGGRVYLRYDHPDGTDRYIPVVYDAGLGMDGLIAPGREQAAIRLLSPDPYWMRGTGTATVAGQTSISNANHILMNTGGGWSNLANGVTGGVQGSIFTAVIGTDGTLYAGGEFTSPYNYIAKWNGSAWSAVGSGISGGYCYSLAVGPDGAIYAAGSFTSPYNYIAKWDGSTWSTLAGFPHWCQIIAVSSTGTVYAVDNNTSSVYQWTGSSWSILGSAMGAGVRCLAVSPNGTLYAGGEFLTAGGVSANRIAKWDGSAWSALGSGLNGAAWAIAFGPDGSLYAGGVFTTAGGVSANRIAKWNGSAWSALGSGLNGQCYTVSFDSNGILYAGGQFSTAGGVPLLDSAAAWYGGQWQPIDVNLPGSSLLGGVLSNGDSIYMMFTTAGTAIVNGSATVNNTGTAGARPIITITGGGRLYSLRNYTTGEAIFFDLTMISGETLTLDLVNLTFTSNGRGNLIASILAGSDLATWHLAPGSNSVTLSSADSGASATLSWDIKYWSLD